MATMSTTSIRVDPLSTREATSRPKGIRTMLSGSASEKSSPSTMFWMPAPTAPAACCTSEPPVTPTARSARRRPDARRRMSPRTVSAAPAERYSSFTLESRPAPTTSSLASPSRRATIGRVRLTPWTRSRGARRCVRKSTPERTSTSSSLMRNVWNRQDNRKATRSTISTARAPPAAMRIRLFAKRKSTGSGGRTPGGRSVTDGRNSSSRRSRMLATITPMTTRRNRPPRSSGVSGCSRCHSPSLSGERTSVRGGASSEAAAPSAAAPAAATPEAAAPADAAPAGGGPHAGSGAERPGADASGPGAGFDAWGIEGSVTVRSVGSRRRR
ncbi:hypothetical protein SRABI128_02776 [Microbacterium sp. Bi128]|nr:hypothetical protein SRABI128_02776 [Microbacterium sp. Bi128]